jgi:quercetin dioxygenase-like cupin family protein
VLLTAAGAGFSSRRNSPTLPHVPQTWKKDQLEWRDIAPGVVPAALHRHEQGGGAALFKMSAGATLPEHDHVAGEHIYVLAGDLKIGSLSLETGDALWIEPGERHDVRALNDASFIAVSPPKRSPLVTPP